FTTADLAQDPVRILGPYEPRRRLIVLSEILGDGGDQFLHTAEGAASDALLGDLPKPALHHVEPRTARGDEVQVAPRVALQPALDRRALVGAGIVDDQV